MKINNYLTETLGIEFPVIMAPMHYVSNIEMVKEAMKNGIAGTFPSLNYRKEGELEKILDDLNLFLETEKPSGTYGINLIVGKTNPFYEKPKKVLKPKSVKLISWKDLLEKIKKIGFEVIVFFLSFTMLMLELAVLIYLEMGG